ncbi:hypothetical protein HK102_004074 [Quaeritorhiza haematococci]|nr:hypothetical protein HK102_004074 [Quaeritorhiza haematococci]
MKLRAWHSVLSKDLYEYSGMLRQSGAETTKLDKTRHAYPHHDIVKPETERLCQHVYQLYRTVRRLYHSHYGQLQYVFGIAAFAQFHFLDIHPFSDYNGRLASFLSKLLLDWVLPLPVAVFKDRDSYLAALEAGRQEADPANGPAQLYELLLKSTADQLQDLVSYVNGQRHFDRLICAADEDELGNKLRHSVKRLLKPV